jgi:hypothetical protein
MLWVGGFDSLAASAEFPGMPLSSDQVFTFLGNRFAKWEITLQPNASLPYIDIKEGPLSQAQNRIFLDWETLNDLVRHIKMGNP